MHITDDSFKKNSNMSDRISKSVEHELECGSVTAKYCTRRWATDWKAQK